MEPHNDTTEESPGFRLQLTGKVAIVFELENCGPITFNLNDVGQATELLKNVLNAMGSNTLTVGEYSEENNEETTISKILFGENN